MKLLVSINFDSVGWLGLGVREGIGASQQMPATRKQWRVPIAPILLLISTEPMQSLRPGQVFRRIQRRILRRRRTESRSSLYVRREASAGSVHQQFETRPFPRAALLHLTLCPIIASLPDCKRFPTISQGTQGKTFSGATRNYATDRTAL